MNISQTAKHIEALVQSGQPTFESVYPSLYLDVKSKGTASWIIRYQLFGKRRQYKIGGYGKGHEELLDLEGAIKLTIDCRQKLNDGIDPKLDIERQMQPKLVTFDDCANKYLEKKRTKIKTAYVYERVYNNEIKPHLGNIRIDRIHSYDIDNVIQRVLDSGRPAIANQVLLFIKRVYRLATKYGAVTVNIAQEFSQVDDAGGADTKRQRFLEEQEIESAFAVFREHPIKIPRSTYIALALLLLLGNRKMELLSAKWEQVDLKRQTFKLFANNTKTDAALVIPIPDKVLPLFQDLHLLSGDHEYLFPKRRASKHPHISPDTINDAVACLFGISYGNRKRGPNYMKEEGVHHFTLHDLRRTFRTLLSKLGVRRDVAEKCMNHSLKGVEKTYDCYGFFPERVDALNRLADLVMPLIQYKPMTITNL
ncbi:MAG: tyrosine-type recombinase/integrase [Pseudomonadota bacterium]|uniref:tyrosine-type recombinase/integrase n=1 Tax=Candidatus Enterovibrio escicola TaxID=1927127 RepID=UPI001237F0C4|nr:site-specific integrase [Candidatus Enterovibrio escacola]MEC8747936.1 tyrosine-type recombinase/integrase [Pseudomonadota bacterium]MEE3130011.1 tyrosine-type recombinase/integrase [Pseudomonadota bacterium]